MNAVRIGRGLVAGIRPRPRIVHLGLGAFHKAHQAAVTWAAADRADWGIRAFAGRSGPDAELAAQDGVFTLITRSSGKVEAAPVGSIVGVHGADSDAFTAAVSDPATALVTITVTEQGWHLDAAGELDLDHPAVRADLDALRTHPGSRVRTLWGRLHAGLAARAAVGAGPLALVPCDNISANGTTLREGLTAFADAVIPGDHRAMDRIATCVSTSVDRITPHLPRDDVRSLARDLGFDDRCAVITERPFAWTLAGEFPAGRPAWETAGAEIVDDVSLHERRKLWLLNGAHLVLALVGRSLGHRTTSQAMADARVSAQVEAYWSEAASVLGPVATTDYLRGLRERLSDVGVDYPLAQIATDVAEKLRVRIVPVVRARHERGLTAPRCADLVARWIVGSADSVDAGIERLFGRQVPEGFVETLRAALAHTRGATSS